MRAPLEMEEMVADPVAGDGRRSGAGVPVEMIELGCSFGELKVLDGFGLRLGAGELGALLGPSGSGKTTALRALAGLVPVDRGRILVGGTDVTTLPAHRRGMGIVFQAYSLFPNMTAADNVSFGLRLRGVARDQCRRRAEELLELMGLGAHAHRYPHQLSGGQQQRVALGRALAIQPPVLLLDEPLSALDAKVRVQLREEIRRIQREVGTTTLFVTHDQEEALSMGDHVGVMERGRLLQWGTPSEVYAAPADIFVAEFVGAVNRLRGVISEESTVEVGARRLPLPQSATTSRTGTLVDVLVRPEAVRVRPDEAGEAVITAHSFLGPIVRVEARLGDGTRILAAVFGADVGALTPGTRVSVDTTEAPLFVVPSEGSR